MNPLLAFCHPWRRIGAHWNFPYPLLAAALLTTIAVSSALAEPQRAPTPSPAFEIRAPSLKLKLARNGEVVGIVLADGKRERFVRAFTRLSGCLLQGEVQDKPVRDGGIEFIRTLVSKQQQKCVVTDRFTPTKDSVRWEVELRGEGPFWSAPICTTLEWPEPETARLWTAWQDPVDPQLSVTDEDLVWNDPLIPQPFSTRMWNYGRTSTGDFSEVTGGELITMPMVSVLLPGENLGLSLIQSPKDVFIDMQLTTSRKGMLSLQRNEHRLGGGKVVRLTMDLVSHPADWRAPLGWMVKHYPDYFDPPNSHVDAMAGTAAYTGSEREVDADRLKRMAFRTVWKLSDDYPYMGLFLPPLKNPDDRWDRTSESGDPPAYKSQWTSFRRMNDYARWLRGNGFYLLSYFNTTEFGRDMQDVSVSPSQAKAADLWKNPSAYLKVCLPNAPVRPLEVGWQGGWVVDPGDPAYRDHLMEQASRHIRMIPDASGICIDRTDYLRACNTNADDGLTWHNGHPARSLALSWRLLMDKMGPLLHRQDKVIFCNFMHPRLDLAQHLDGLYDEFGNRPTVLNGASVLCVNKPLLVWTANNQVLEDAFFQRHLYLGAFPTAPYPRNHYCIQPGMDRDRWYYDYGPMLALMSGRKWVLEPNVIAAQDNAAKVNLFRVPGGYAIPVTFAGKAGVIRVIVRQLKGMTLQSKVFVLHPGVSAPTSIKPRVANGQYILDVPVIRGCAMVKVR